LFQTKYLVGKNKILESLIILNMLYRVIKPITALKCFQLLTVLFLACVMVSSCRQKNPRETVIKEIARETVSIKGFEIPRFKSATRQLEYARSSFTSVNEQKAALEAVVKLFPHSREKVAEALLDLVYFGLGDDYRLASKELCEETLTQLQNLIREYNEIHQVCAKAQWYIGWIYTDLLRKPSMGLAAYRKVVSCYPTEVFYISSSFGSALFNYSKIGTGLEETMEKHWWGALALLEIFRHSDGYEEKLNITSELVSRYPSDLATGYALLDMVSSHTPSTKIEQFARRYIEINKRNKALAFIVRKIENALGISYLKK